MIDPTSRYPHGASENLPQPDERSRARSGWYTIGVVPRTAAVVADARDAIRDKIISGDLSPGDRLVERTLGAELAVSRVPVREALRELVAAGYAEQRATGGIAVRAYTADEIEELVAANAALETLLVTRLAREASEGDVTALRVVLAETATAIANGDTAAAIDGNARFHEVLSARARPGVTTELLALIGPRLRWLQRQHTDPRAIHAEHVAITDAIAAGDAEVAAGLLRDHAVTSRAAAVNLHGGT